MIDIKIGFKADNNTKGIARSKKLPIKLPNNKSIPINFGNKYGYKRTENNISKKSFVEKFLASVKAKMYGNK